LSQLLSGAAEIQLGALAPVRDLNYVANTVDGFLALASSEEAIGQVVNLGSGSGVTIEHLARLAMKVVGREVPIRCDEQRVRPSASEVYTLMCDHTLATQLTHWQPQVDLENGLQLTAEFIAQHLDLYRPQEYIR
jgi:nucleoside-diphosphate-sugar epimerase